MWQFSLAQILLAMSTSAVMLAVGVACGQKLPGSVVAVIATPIVSLWIPVAWRKRDWPQLLVQCSGLLFLAAQPMPVARFLGDTIQGYEVTWMVLTSSLEPLMSRDWSIPRIGEAAIWGSWCLANLLMAVLPHRTRRVSFKPRWWAAAMLTACVLAWMWVSSGFKIGYYTWQLAITVATIGLVWGAIAKPVVSMNRFDRRPLVS